MKKLQSFAHYLSTSVRAEIRGTSPERFLNLCAQHEIHVWGIEYRESNCLRVSMSARSFLSIAPLVRRSACQIRIVNRRGVHYGMKRLWKKKLLACTLLVFLGICVLMNTMVLSFEFTGYETVQPRQIMEAMQKNGLDFGTFKRTVDASDLRNVILMEIPELIWFTVTFHGSHATVDVREREPVPEVINEALPADIISDFHGVVRDLSVYKGQAQVKIGDVVTPGTLLVSGAVDLRLDGKSLVTHARADVLADVWYKTTLALPLTGTGKTPTGREKTRWALVIGKKRINFYKNDGKVFDNYDKIITRHTLSLGGWEFPVTLVEERYIEYETFDAAFSAQDLAADLTATARRITQSLDAGVEITSASARESGEILYAYAYGKCERNIGQTVVRE